MRFVTLFILLLMPTLIRADEFLPNTDPFKPFIKTELEKPKTEDNLLPIQRLKLSEFTLKGIIYDPRRPLALVNDNSGKGYILKIGDPIGPLGHVKSITRKKVIVEEVYTDIFEGKKTRMVELNLPKKEEVK